MIRIIFNAAVAAVISFASFLYDKEDYHTSAPSGAGWVHKLLEGYPDRICCELDMNKHVFHFLISYLQLIRIKHSRRITLEKQFTNFLYRCVTEILVCHTGQRFQRSKDIVSK